MDLLIIKKKKYNKLLDKLTFYNNNYKNTIDNINLPNNDIINTYIELDSVKYKNTIINENNIYINKVYENKLNYINPQTSMLDFLKIYIKNKYFLIISPNIYLTELYLSLIKDIKIVLFIFNIFEINSFLLLKKKYNLQIDIYYLGKYVNYNSYIIITDICNKYYNDIKFENIVIDPGINDSKNHNIIIQIIGLLLANNFLKENSYYISLMRSQIINDDYYMYILNLLYKSFQIHMIYPNSILKRSFNMFYEHKNGNYIINNFFNFFNFKKIIDNDILIKYLKNIDLLLNTKINFKDIDNNLCKNLVLNIINETFYLKELINILKSNVTFKQKRLSYHNNSMRFHTSNIPETTNDLSNQSQYIGDARDYQSRCHWGQKKLVLSEIQFLTKVCQKLNTKSLKDYAVVYVGAAHGFHFPILYNLFPELIWILYDPAKFSKEAHMHPEKQKVKIFNQFFTDETIKHAKQNAENRKILFISDIRLTPNEEAVMKDMISQAKWGTELGADYMLLKYKPPYEDENTKQFKTNTIYDLQLNPKYIKNPELKADDKTFLYLKGDVYIQLFAHIHSVELRLMVEKVNGKYELDTINYGEIEKKMFYFNTNLRTSWSTENYDFLHYIPGYDSSIECVMEYLIIKNYYEYLHNIKDNNIIIQKMFDMAYFLEKIAHTTFINCNYDTMIRTIKKFEKENDDNKLKRIKLWKEISKLNIELSAKTQKEIIINTGKEVIGQERVNRAIKYLDRYITNRTFIKIE